MVPLIIVLVVLVVVALVAVAMYNGLIRKRNQGRERWSQIDVQLKRRLDLIPNLVETVKAYAAHEKSTLDAVIEARNKAMAAPSTPRRPGRCRPAAERRPPPTLRPERGLSGPEGQPELLGPAGGTHRDGGPGRLRTAVLQRHRARLQQNKLDTFPTMIFARMMNFQRREYFEADAAAREVPKVQF